MQIRPGPTRSGQARSGAGGQRPAERSDPATPSTAAGPDTLIPGQHRPDEIESADHAGVESEEWRRPTWDEVVRSHSARVYRLAYRLTGNSHDAEDLTQEVFVRVFRSLDAFQPGTFDGWIHRITTNLFLDQARRKKRIRFDALPDNAAERLPSALPAPDFGLVDATFDDDIELALADLRPEFRAAVVLCDVEGLSYEEIALVLDVKVGTVRSRIHRGRAMLRKALAHRAPTATRTRIGGALDGGAAGGGS